MTEGIGFMDDVILGLTASWFTTTIWGASISLVVLSFVKFRGKG